jgi:hypothetical protein
MLSFVETHLFTRIVGDYEVQDIPARALQRIKRELDD